MVHIKRSGGNKLKTFKSETQKHAAVGKKLRNRAHHIGAATKIINGDNTRRMQQVDRAVEATIDLYESKALSPATKYHIQQEVAQEASHKKAHHRLRHTEMADVARHVMTAQLVSVIANNRAQLHTNQIRGVMTQVVAEHRQNAAIANIKSTAQHHKQHHKRVAAAVGMTTRATTAKKGLKMNYKQAQFRSFATTNYPPHEVLAMPALSPTMEMGKLASWEKKVGDKVTAGDVLCQVETDKATVSFDSTEDGYIAKILVPAGTADVPIGKPVAILVDDEELVAKFADYEEGGAAAAAPAAKAQEAAPAAAAPVAEETAKRPCGVYIAPESPQAVTFKTGGKIMASPLARVTAAEQGVDLSTVKGTGMYGSITKHDVLTAPKAVVETVKIIEKAVAGAAAAKAVEQPKKAAQPTQQQFANDADGDYTDEPLTNMRKVIAKRLTESKQTVPHYYVTVEVEMDAVNKLRGEFNKTLAASAGKDQTPVKLSVNDFIIKAAAGALKKVPDVNTTWHDTYIRRYNYADISVAVSTDGGLITPIIPDADIKGLAAISTEMKTLAGKARNNKLQPHEYQGGTFTISNLGMFGVDQFAAIVNPPQSGILAIGAAQQKVVPNPAYNPQDPTSKEFKVVNVMKATGSFNHASVDGAVGAKFLGAFKDYMEKPHTLLL